MAGCVSTEEEDCTKPTQTPSRNRSGSSSAGGLETKLLLSISKLRTTIKLIHSKNNYEINSLQKQSCSARWEPLHLIQHCFTADAPTSHTLQPLKKGFTNKPPARRSPCRFVVVLGKPQTTVEQWEDKHSSEVTLTNSIMCFHQHSTSLLSE